MKAVLNDLDQLEHESVFTFRETFAQFQKPALMFSGGKDSITLVRLAQKAFAPQPIPFPLLHIDTGHNFPETLEFRDRLVKELGAQLIVRSVENSIRENKVMEERGPYSSRNKLQSVTLLDAVEEFGFDALIGGARRDEEKARAKERVFSVRNEFGAWEPRLQRPEIWQILNGKINPGEHMRVFPLSNWTELDVWNYIDKENMDLPPLYFSHRRKVVRLKSGTLLGVSDFMETNPEDPVEEMDVRFRTIGDMTCTGALESKAKTIPDVIAEIKASTLTERGTRADDKRSEAAMEERKREGYF